MDQVESKLSLKPRASIQLSLSLGKLTSECANALEEADARRAEVSLQQSEACCEVSWRRSLRQFESFRNLETSQFFAGQTILVRPGDRDARHERRLSQRLLMLNPGHPERDGLKDQRAIHHGDMTIRQMRRRKLKTSTRTV